MPFLLSSGSVLIAGMVLDMEDVHFKTGLQRTFFFTLAIFLALFLCNVKTKTARGLLCLILFLIALVFSKERTNANFKSVYCRILT